ncbi:MAG: cellulase family glycosylhydrolase [Acidobacteriota bacterium]
MKITRRSLAVLPFVGAALLRGQSAPPTQRGVVIGPAFVPNDIFTLAGWGVNLIRFQMIWQGNENNQDLTAYRAWWNQRLAFLDTLLPSLEANKIKVIIDMHTGPGGQAAGAGHVLFFNRTLHEGFQSIWEDTAHRYRNRPGVYAFDLLNEPSFNEKRTPPMLSSWETLAERTIERIRKQDDDRIVSFQPKGIDLTAFKGLTRLGPRKVLYSLHMYEPLNFTHQGIDGRPAHVQYPGTIDGRYFDKAELRRRLLPARDFQLANNVGIYVGEFSANLQGANVVPTGSAATYLNDCISLFEEWGWRWTYHAFQDNPYYWNLDRRDDASRNLILNYFRRNSPAALTYPAP